MNLSDSVSVLPGCGATKTQRLRGVGVITLRDLINYTGPAPPGVNIGQMKCLVGFQQQTQLPPTQMLSTMAYPTASTSSGVATPRTKSHSWYNLAGHILHRQGATTRVHLGELMIAPYGVVIATSWRRGGKWRFRAVTPLMLACTFVLWNRSEIVSDDSDEEEEAKGTKPSIPMYLVAGTDLPHFELLPDCIWSLTDIQTDQLKLAMREVQLYQAHSVLSIEDQGSGAL